MSQQGCDPAWGRHMTFPDFMHLKRDRYVYALQYTHWYSSSGTSSSSILSASGQLSASPSVMKHRWGLAARCLVMNSSRWLISRARIRSRAGASHLAVWIVNPPLVIPSAAVHRSSSWEKHGWRRNCWSLSTPERPYGSQSQGAKLTASVKLKP